MHLINAWNMANIQPDVTVFWTSTLKSTISQIYIWVYDQFIYWKATQFITLYLRTTLSPQSRTAIRVKQIQTSIGSTSCAITTSWAFFCSTNFVTQLLPWRKTFGLFVGASSFFATFASARARSLAFFAYAVSGRYFSKILNSAWAEINSTLAITIWK